jgi:hypothetical protein
VTSTVGTPRSRSVSKTKSRSCWRSATSSLPKGSSSSSACGSASSARSSDTRARWPPDRLAGSAAAHAGQAGAGQRLRRRGAHAHGGAPAGSANNRLSQHRQVREQQVVLEQQADAALLGRPVR